MLPPFEDHYSITADGCWLWIGRVGRNGYGRYGIKEAHRFSYQLRNGPIPAGMCVCHSCDNPLCVNPAHLFLGTRSDNLRDMSLKGRAGNQYGGQAATHCVNGHEYTPENTYWRAGKIASRNCRACGRERAKAYQARRAA